MAAHRVEGNQSPFGKARRSLTVAISALLTLALCILYAVGDAFDIVPGFTTYQPQQATGSTISSAQQAITAKSLISDMDLTKAVDSSAAQQAVQTLLAAEGVGTDTSVIIGDAAGKEIASANATTPREPASTLKTLTALAASEKLDMRSTLDTAVYLGDIAGKTAAITLRGNGDMMLQTGASDPKHVNGRAGLQTLVNKTVTALKKQGISSVRIGYDDSLLGTKRTPSDMRDSMISGGNFTPVASMAIDEGKQWGTSTKPTNPDALLTWLPTRTKEPAKLTAQAFAQQMQAAGMTVEGDVSETALPDSVLKDSKAKLATVSSAQLWELLRFSLQQSDNTYAELFGRLVALKTGQENSPSGAVAAVMKNLQSNNIDTTGLHLSDCSGLSDNSKLTATALIQTQEKYLSTANAAAFEGLAVSGFSGTALERSFDRNVDGLVRLKTGSLNKTTSMTGSVVRANGGIVFFAVIVNNPTNMWSARQAVDAFVGSLTNL